MLLGHVFDMVVLEGLAFGIANWGIVPAAGVAFFLHVAFHLTIAAGDVWVPGPIGASLTIGVSLSPSIPLGGKPIIAGWNCSHLLNLLLSEVLPGNGLGILR